MRSLLTVLLTGLAVVALAGCGGSNVSTLPPADGGRTSVERATLWVGYELNLNAFSITGSGPIGPATGVGTSGKWFGGTVAPSVAAVAVAPDGTRWVLERPFVWGGPEWQLYGYAPGASQPTYTIRDSTGTYAFALALGTDGVMVAYGDGNGGTTIATYPYAASGAHSIRTFHTTAPVFGIAVRHLGDLYVARPSGVDIYAPTSTGCCPLRSIATPTGPGHHVTIGAQEFAVGPDGSVYIMDLPGNNANPVMFVDVYSPDSGSPPRRIGPLPSSYVGFHWPVITVDSQNRLYVATERKIYRFGPTANGADAPEAVTIDPTPDNPVAMALGPAR